MAESFGGVVPIPPVYFAQLLIAEKKCDRLLCEEFIEGFHVNQQFRDYRCRAYR